MFFSENLLSKFNIIVNLINKKFFALVIFLFLLLFLSASMFAGRIYGAETVEIINQQIKRDLLQTEGNLAAEIEVKNFALEAKEIWLGYSFRDPDGSWHDIPAQNLQLQADSSNIIEITERVFPEGEVIPGDYLFVAAAWDAPPGDDAERLSDMIQREKIFNDDIKEEQKEGPGGDTARRAENLALEFSGYDFLKATHKLGRGRLRPENVRREDGQIKILSPEASFQGGEIRTKKLFGYGSYQVKMKTDYAPGSFSAFFLYEDVERENDEIDIEIFNDSSRKIDFVTFDDGVKTNHETAKLSFDPAADYHEYRIVYLPELIAFYAEGELLASFDSNLPSAEMRIMVNHWWPNWLEAETEHSASEISIKEFEFQEF